MLGSRAGPCKSAPVGGFMGFRFRRSLKIAPGLRLNFSKSGISTSIGGPGATYNIGPRGTRTTVGLPGTGLLWTSTSGRGEASGSVDPAGSATGATRVPGCVWLLGILALIATVGMCNSKAPSPSVPPAAAPPESSSYFVRVRSANCRSAPASGARVISAVKRAESVEVSEKSGEWSHVVSGGRDCWVASDLLSGSQPDLTLPQAGPDVAASTAAALGAMSSTASAARSLPGHRHRAHSSGDPGCPCSGTRICTGPRGGRYCITSGGNKRYGV